MTKTELLADLAGRDFVQSVSTPELLETKPDGAKWYGVNIREVTGDAGVYRNIQFYVYDEGGAGEEAFYKDSAPGSSARASAFRMWMQDTVDNLPNNFKAIQIHWISERWEMVVYSILAGTNPLSQKTYYIRKGVGASVEIENFDIGLMQSQFDV